MPPPSPTLADVLALASEGGRVCPLPQAWARLYALLPDTRHDGYGTIPPEPLAQAVWADSGDEQKRVRFREHLEWAAQHAALPVVRAYLATLPESAWHHAGD